MQYTLSDQNGGKIDLSAVGETTENCRALELSGEIEKFAAFYSTETESVSAIRYMKKPEGDSIEGKMVTFGPFPDPDSEECNI